MRFIVIVGKRYNIGTKPQNTLYMMPSSPRSFKRLLSTLNYRKTYLGMQYCNALAKPTLPVEKKFHPMLKLVQKRKIHMVPSPLRPLPRLIVIRLNSQKPTFERSLQLLPRSLQLLQKSYWWMSTRCLSRSQTNLKQDSW